MTAPSTEPVDIQHQREHQMIADAVREDWLDRDMLLVHLASRHGHAVADVQNDGMVPLVAMHDHAHGEADVLGVGPIRPLTKGRRTT